MRRVLVVDDDPSVVEVITVNLKADGYAVETAGDGEEAWDQVLAAPPDLMVLDWMLPGRGGLELLVDMRRDARTCRIPVVVLTAKARDEDVWAGWQAGVDRYLTKPFRVDELLYYVGELLAARDLEVAE